jgi:hypothetical protein
MGIREIAAFYIRFNFHFGESGWYPSKLKLGGIFSESLLADGRKVPPDLA